VPESTGRFNLRRKPAAVEKFQCLLGLSRDSESILTLGVGSGLLLGLAGVWHLLRRLDRVAQLRRERRLLDKGNAVRKPPRYPWKKKYTRRDSNP
ncbi:MAG TPA: hypothetical protein VK327_17030, partial [Candidatus Paceibacterota bacterium]|nr:hypothetical protein [Candidatus Paceibacterota bacterium]